MRHVYFSFHYRDVWKANQIRNSGVVGGARSAGFADRSLWEEAKRKNDAALRRLINDGLAGTTVTVVLIGEKTASRRWVDYEINQSIERGNALLGIHIHKVPDASGRTARKGPLPRLLKEAGAPIHEWTNVKDFGRWVEAAWQEKNEEPDLLTKIGRWLQT